MRTLWVLLLVLAIPAVSAQGEFDFSNDYHARIAVGDVPLTGAVEPTDVLHVVEYMRFTHDGNSTTLDLPAHVARGCDCTAYSFQDGQATIGNTVEAGTYVFWIRNEVAATTATAFSLQWAEGQTGRAVVYHAAGLEVTAAGAGQTLPCAQECVGQFTFFDGNLDGFWATVHPATTTPTTPTVTDDGFGYLELVLGLIVGIAVWFWLVQKGFVQARSRKQVVAKAAHQLAKEESQEVLAARKRVLMAGLKELEMAKMKSEVDDVTYDLLKAELKKEAVATMRAIDS